MEAAVEAPAAAVVPEAAVELAVAEAPAVAAVPEAAEAVEAPAVAAGSSPRVVVYTLVGVYTPVDNTPAPAAGNT